MQTNKLIKGAHGAAEPGERILSGQKAWGRTTFRHTGRHVGRREHAGQRMVRGAQRMRTEMPGEVAQDLCGLCCEAHSHTLELLSSCCHVTCVPVCVALNAYCEQPDAAVSTGSERLMLHRGLAVCC